MMEAKYCRDCDDELTDENWYLSHRKSHSYICKECHKKQSRLWYKANLEKRSASIARWQKANHDKVIANSTRINRKNGELPMSENKDCPAFLGVHIVERLLRHYFKDVVMMPYGNPGYDFICNRDKLIDAKSSCLGKNGRWFFNIDHNTTADFFVCVAFDNRADLNVIHVWMIPGSVVNHLKCASISLSTVHKWDKYERDVGKISACCNEMKNGGE